MSFESNFARRPRPQSEQSSSDEKQWDYGIDWEADRRRYEEEMKELERQGIVLSEEEKKRASQIVDELMDQSYYDTKESSPQNE